MAMLLAVTDQNNSEQVLRLAEELPFSWELVTYDTWLSTLNLVKAYLQGNALEGMAQTLLEGALEQQFALMSQADPVLAKTILILRQRLLGKPEQELKEALLLASPGIVNQLIELASGDLLSQHGADEQWPEFDSDLLDYLKRAASGGIQGLCTGQAWYMKAVLHAPIVMAFRAGAMPPDQRPDLEKKDLYQLRRIREFAPEWYQEAYGLTTLYLYATNSLYESGVPE